MQPLKDIMEPDTVIRVRDGVVVETYVEGVYSPAEFVLMDTLDDDAGSVLKEHEDEYERQIEAQGWKLMRGYSGAYLAGNSFMMHPSEYIGGGMEEHILENPGLYVTFSIEDGSERGTDHWAVAYKEDKS